MKVNGGSEVFSRTSTKMAPPRIRPTSSKPQARNAENYFPVFLRTGFAEGVLVEKRTRAKHSGTCESQMP